MNKVRITAIRQTVYEDLMAQYENPIEHACDVSAGEQWVSDNGQRPEGMCPSAWESMRPFVESLARGEGNFSYAVIDGPGINSNIASAKEKEESQIKYNTPQLIDNILVFLKNWTPGK